MIAARHLHLAPDDARRWGVRDGDRVDIRCGEGARAVTWPDVLVRAGQANATEFHLDEDEARAAALGRGDIARIVAWHERPPTRRVLITEQQLRQLVEAGTALPPNAIYTPGARHRARSLGVVPP
ncbi:MAG: PduL/EutD family phosphate acyltransferase [Gemmatimonadota bacterium]